MTERRARSSSAVSASSSATAGDAFDAQQKLGVVGGDPHSKTFIIKGEDHTLGNVLRHIIMRDPRTAFCGFTVPHPMEDKLHVRVQTNGVALAEDVFKRGLENLAAMCDVAEEKFTVASGAAA